MLLSSKEIDSLLKDMGGVQLPILTSKEIHGIIENEKEVFTYGFFNDIIRETEFNESDTAIEMMYKVTQKAYLMGAFLQLDTMQGILQDIADHNIEVLQKLNEK